MDKKRLKIVRFSLSVIFGVIYTFIYQFHKYVNPDWNLIFIFATGVIFMYLVSNETKK